MRESFLSLIAKTKMGPEIFLVRIDMLCQLWRDCMRSIVRESVLFDFWGSDPMGEILSNPALMACQKSGRRIPDRSNAFL
jgi:hypothetical protein